MRLIANRELTIYGDGGRTSRALVAGEEFEIEPKLGTALQLSGAAREPESEDDVEILIEEEPRKKRRYRRRDMKAED